MLPTLVDASPSHSQFSIFLSKIFFSPIKSMFAPFRPHRLFPLFFQIPKP